MYQDPTSTFEAFYEGTSPRLLRFAYGLTGDLAEAQDLAQEAYARAWPRWKRLLGYENPESWLVPVLIAAQYPVGRRGV